MTPEKYAERFYEVATIIKATDPTALVGFGSIVQPTPIRIRYLERSLERLLELAQPSEKEKKKKKKKKKKKRNENPFDLIDIWTIHNFILNEQEYSALDPDYWGADIPPGFICPEDCFDAFIVENFNYSVTYSIDIFRDRICLFRDWLKSIGEQNKPLWVTEYGSLFPDWEIACPDCGLPPYSPYKEWPTSRDNIQYMLDTFDFLMYSTNRTYGMPFDGNKLVQRWYWYSLNGYVKIIPDRASYGGSLFDPENNKEITSQGIAYKKYVELLIGPKVYLPIIIQ